MTELEYHKAKTLHGQFWSAENVDDYMKKEQDKTKKNEGLYIEMRHAKLSTSSMKRSKCCVSPEKKNKLQESR